MSVFTTKDSVDLYYKDLGDKQAQALVFHHGWPLSSDEWDPQLLFFLNEGYRVIAYDRRGHGRSTQTDLGNDMDTYADDAAQLVKALNVKNAIHIGHSTGGGEVARYAARAEPGRVAGLVLLGSVTPLMVKASSNPTGVDMSVFDGFRSSLAANRAQFFLDVPSGPFYGFNRDGAKVSQGLINNWWRQGMMGGAKAQYDCIKAFSETDFTEDLKVIDTPVAILHGEDDQVVPLETTAKLAAKLLKHSFLKTYSGLSHGMGSTHAELINSDMLTFFKSGGE